MTGIEIRSAELESEVNGNTLSGYASVFGTYADLGSYVETFAPTAFDATLQNPASDVRAYYQHDSKMLLGRQSSGTLKVWTDTRGLGYEIELPKTSYADDVRELADRGDLGGMSIGFRPNPDGETWGRLGNRELRTHTSVLALIEVSPVSIPAYGSTTVQLRSLDHITQPAIDGRTQLFRARFAARYRKGNL
ncbi:phage prohead protease, HK97 family [Mycobacteroides abscessus subsp. abscessus]|nr:phage prohead protease, HK97 family [Mycobacteroides abscessus subsp. abscessus]